MALTEITAPTLERADCLQLLSVRDVSRAPSILDSDLLTDNQSLSSADSISSTTADDHGEALEKSAKDPKNARERPAKPTFDPAVHLNFYPPEKIWSMAELGYDGKGVSPNAVSTPFELFTPEAIQIMRAEIFQREVLVSCQFRSGLAQCQIRGYAARYAPFTYDAWHHPETLAIVSRIAGVDVEVQFDYEIGHVNISVDNPADAPMDLWNVLHQLNINPETAREDDAIVDWHTDSYPFVCVVMLSDCEEMIGGETAIRKNDGGVMRIQCLDQGSAVVLQGRYIEHVAYRASRGAERITMVTSFRPKSPFVRDDSVLTTVRPVSDLLQLYSQYSEYRLEILEERARAQRKLVRRMRDTNKEFDIAGTKSWLIEQKEFLESMLEQIVNKKEVVISA